MTGPAETAASVVLGLGNVAAMILIGRGNRAGWSLALAMQAIWVPYDLVTGQPGLLIITAAAIGPCVRGLAGKPGRRRGRYGRLPRHGRGHDDRPVR